MDVINELAGKYSTIYKPLLSANADRRFFCSQDVASRILNNTIE